MAHVHIVHAPRPSRHAGPVRHTVTAPQPAEPGVLPTDVAFQAFDELRERWRLPADRAWRMLTGKPARPRTLSDDEVRRVALLVAAEAVLATVVRDVGAWAVDPNPGPLLMGWSPVDYLTRLGTPGYLALLRQARRWAEM